MTPTTCPWVQQCLLPFADGLFPGWIARDQYGDRAHADLAAMFCGKGPCLDTLKLTYPGGADFYGALANDLSAAAVPLPASASLLIAAVAAFAIIRRRA